MQTPIYFTFDEFQDNYKIDFVEISKTNDNYTMSIYLDSLEKEYSNRVIYYQNMLSDLQYLKQKINQRNREKLEKFYDKDLVVTVTDVQKDIEKFNKTYILPLEISSMGSNLVKLIEFAEKIISDYGRVVGLINFEINQLIPIDYSNKGLQNKEKLILLDKLGIVELLINQLIEKENATHLAEIIGAITGIDNTKGTLTGYCNYLIRPDNTAPNSPYNSEKTEKKTQQIINKFKINANR